MLLEKYFYPKRSLKSLAKKYFYIKKCLGENKNTIQIYKFRTMSENANKDLEKISANGFDSYGNPLHDSRINSFWVKLLRHYWIDELPQLYNLRKRDIKLVGIRPMRPIDWERYPKDIMERSLKQKPGLFGVQYAFPWTNSFDDHLDNLRTYLDGWGKNPKKTDSRYFSRIVFNIVFKGMRSS